ncbi:MAG: transposase [Proteobacteria bacterium]|nr:transposase [Pseudomonadota bacterium]
MSEGTRLKKACERMGVSARTLQRWLKPATEEDRRCGPRKPPANRLTEAERKQMLTVASSKEFRNLSPKQIVPRLADRGQYIASESSFYRLLREKKQLAHRGKAKVATPRPKPQFVAQKPNQVWSWDITYLKSPVRGMYYYLYNVMDVYSRRIVGWAVHEEECNELASTLFREALQKAGNPTGLVSHSDNGSVMKGSTLLATLQQLGVITSYSRPSVSNITLPSLMADLNRSGLPGSGCKHLSVGTTQSTGTAAFVLSHPMNAISARRLPFYRNDTNCTCVHAGNAQSAGAPSHAIGLPQAP